MSDICTDPGFLKAVLMFKNIIQIVLVAVPLLLIVLGARDFYKVVTAGDADSMKEGLTIFARRCIAGILLFMVPTIVEVIFGFIYEAKGMDNSSFSACIANADSDRIANIEADQKCYVCSSSKSYVWSYEEPSLGCDTWTIDASISSRDKCIYVEPQKPYNPGTPSNSGEENNNNGPYSDPNIKFNWEYVKGETKMPYGIFVPSSASSGKKLPMVIYLHGSGQVGSYVNSGFENSNGPGVFTNWPLDGFNAYVFFPHLVGYSSWHSAAGNAAFFETLDAVIDKYNVDTSKISLSGASLGGIGAQTIGVSGIDRFSAIVVMSGYPSGIDFNVLNQVPVRGYVGDKDANDCISYMNGTFKNNVGADNVFVMNATHHNLPEVSFTEDKNGDNHSDLIEWMLSQTKN